MSQNGIKSIGYIAWKNVVRKIFRNVILVLAVGLLVALLVFAMIFNRAIKEDLEAATKKLGADIVLVPAEAKDVAEEFILESKEKTFFMDSFVYDAVMELPEIKEATYHIYLETLDAGCCSIDEGQVVVFDQKTDFVIQNWLVDDAPKLQEGQIYVGSYVYEYLGLINTATLFGKGVKVVGHLQKTGTGLDHGIFMRTEDMDKISSTAVGNYKKGNISIIFLKIQEELDPAEVVAKIRDVNPRIGIMTRGNIGADVRATLKDIIRVFTVTILISSVLAILLAWSTFTALTNERRREVGILRALGAHRSHILQMFLSEALIISTIGGLLGIFIGHQLISQLADDFNLITKIGAISGFSLNNIFISIISMLSGMAICLVGAIIPVTRLSRMEPLVAIKEE